MKKQLCGLLMLAFSLAIFSGCSDGPANPVTAPTTNQTPEFIMLPKRLDKSLMKQVSVTQFFYAAQGGTLRLRDTYRAAPDSHLVTIDITLKFEPNDLPYDASLTLTIDDVVFLTSVDLTFGPHGIVFNHPAKLEVEATGLDLDINSTRRLRLYYVNDNGVWERMPGSEGSYIVYGGRLEAEGRLPHFSQYAFGRIE